MSDPVCVPITPCAWSPWPGRPCSARPAGFDVERRVYLCAAHMAYRTVTAPAEAVEAAIEGAYAVLRSHDWRIRQIQEQGE
jgi:hypothetical protein